MVLLVEGDEVRVRVRVSYDVMREKKKRKEERREMSK